MLQHLGRHPELSIEDFKDLSCPLHLAIGDRDKTAGLSATVSVYQQMDNAELNVLPATPHPIEEVNIELLAASLESFFVK
jgi:pimeloyl-ACP methyl ester carboxylesterase